MEDLIAEKPELEAPLDAMLQAARALAGLGWRERIAGACAEAGRPMLVFSVMARCVVGSPPAEVEHRLSRQPERKIKPAHFFHPHAVRCRSGNRDTVAKK